MLKYIIPFALAMASLTATAHADTPAPLQVSAEGITPQGFIEPKYAFCIKGDKGHAPGENFNVGLRWSAGPLTTKSYAVILVDEDVPADFTDANKEGKTIPVSMQRRPFYHWVLLDIPANITAIPAGADSNSPRQKAAGMTSYGMSGINDYSSSGKIHGGYDGPCPPWNDERVHNYHFKVYALDVAKINVESNVNGEQAMKAIEPHIIATGEVVGKYTTNPKVK